MIKLFFSLIIGLLLISQIVFSQQPVVLSLDKAVELALDRNLSMIQSQNNIDAANSRVLAAYGGYLPTISASGSWNRTDNRRVGIPITSTSTTNDFSTQVGASYTIFDGLRRESNLKRTLSDAKSIEQTALRTRQTIRYQVSAAYLDILRQEQLVKVAEENLKRDQQQLQRITESNRVGALSLADVYRQQSQVASDELLLINAQNSYNKAKADLAALIGLDMSLEYQFYDPTISNKIDSLELYSEREKYKDIDNLINRALASRPDYLAARENKRSTEASVTAAWGGYIPSISASASYSLSNDKLSQLKDNRSISWGIGLRWNIFDGFLTNQSVQTAIVNQKNAEENLKQMERNIVVEIKNAVLDLESRLKQVEVSQKGVQSASEDYKIAEERYNLGAGTLLDLLTAHAGYVNAQANNINAVYFYITAKKNLDYVLGELK